jgi:hypothetical protein
MKFVFFFILFSATCLAQSNPTIRTGRPGQSIGPYVVGTDYFQVQSGVDQAWSRGDSKTNTTVINNVLRYGLSESFEVSSVINLQQDSFPESQTAEKSGVSDFQLGFRFNLIEKPEGIIPGVGIQTRFKFTQVDSDYRADHMAPIFTFVTNHNLTRDVAWVHNIGVSYDGFTTIPKYILISNVSFPLTGNWGSFVEVYSNSQESIVSVFADAGLAYLYNKDLQYDLSFGGGENHGISESFVSVGISWRSKTRNK